MVVNESGEREGGFEEASVDDTAAADRLLALLGRPVRLLFLGLTLLATLGAVASVSLPTELRYFPLAISLVVFGLPHGAVDHLVPARLGGRDGPLTAPRRSAAAVGVAYLLLGGAYALVWLRAPRVAALAFIALTVLHWGQGDVWVLVELLGAAHLQSRTLRVGTLLVRGGLPMLVPLLAFPGRYRAVMSAWTALFGVQLDLPWLFAPRTRAILGLGFGLLTLGTLAAGRLRIMTRASARRAWRVDAAETGLLWAYFLLVPPLVAVGLYFTCWHALRHIARLVLLDPSARRPTGSPGLIEWFRRAGTRFARDAAPLTLLSLAQGDEQGQGEERPDRPRVRRALSRLRLRGDAAPRRRRGGDGLRRRGLDRRIREWFGARAMIRHQERRAN